MHSRNGQRVERGVVLVMVLICLTLLCTIGVLMMLNAGVESILNGNYRASTRAFYASLSGLEEARGRLWPQDPNNLGPYLLAAGTPMQVGQVIYITNGQDVAPLDPSNPYADLEYGQEFATPPTNPQFVTSASSVGPYDAPSFKWVRINPVTEKSLNIDVNGDGTMDPSTPLFYDGAHLYLYLPNMAGRQAFEITALAVLPDKSRKMLQYVVGGATLLGSLAQGGSQVLQFPAALTLDGNVETFNPSGNSNNFAFGTDQHYGMTCSPVESDKPAIGIHGYGVDVVIRSIIPPMRGNYVGSDGTPSVGDIGNVLAAPFQTVNSLDGPGGLVQIVTQNADFVLPAPQNGQVTSLPDYGSPSSPAITVVQGDLSLSGVTGYGLLLVTGNLTLSGDVSWNGVILVIGQGTLTIPSYGSGKIIGAVLLAHTRDASNNLLSNLGPVSFNVTNPNYGNNGFYYNSCWVNAVQNNLFYKTVSFREIPQ